MMGIVMDGLFSLDDLAEDFAQDRVFEFLRVDPMSSSKIRASSSTNPLVVK